MRSLRKVRGLSLIIKMQLIAKIPAPTSKRGLATRATCQGRDVEK